MTKIFKPEATVVRTPLDEIGSLLNVDRIPGEELKDYAERLYGTYVKRSSSTYEGLLNGINRAIGLTEQEIAEIRYRSIMTGTIDGSIVLVTQNSIQDTLSYSGTVNGSTITAVGTKFTNTGAQWIPNRLKGMTLTIGANTYEILSNTSTQAKVDGDMSNLVGQSFTIALNLEENILNGLALRVNGQIYKITANTSNKLFIDNGNLLKLENKEYVVTAYNPKIEVTASKLYLYKEYTNESNFQLEKQIDIRRDFKFHTGIVDEINKLYYFEADNLMGYKDRILSTSLRKQSSEHAVSREIVPAAKFFRLKNTDLKEGSVAFSESSVFLRETNEEQVSQAPGNYHIEHRSGSVLVNTMPSGNKTVSYIWNEFPYRLISSPAVVNAMADEEVKDFLFSQVEMRLYDNEKNKFVPSQPTGDMLEYIAELLRVKPQTWGD